MDRLMPILNKYSELAQPLKLNDHEAEYNVTTVGCVASFIRILESKNIILTDDEIQEISSYLLPRIAIVLHLLHNKKTRLSGDDTKKLSGELLLLFGFGDKETLKVEIGRIKEKGIIECLLDYSNELQKTIKHLSAEEVNIILTTLIKVVG